jgi:uncharacterized protein (DUF4415 family)
MKGKPTKKETGTSDRLTPQQKAELDALAAMPDDEIDTSDIPEIRDWTGFKRGLFYKPVKRQLTLRVDADVVDWFKEHAPSGKGYQTRMNLALRQYVTKHKREKKSSAS